MEQHRQVILEAWARIERLDDPADYNRKDVMAAFGDIAESMWKICRYKRDLESIRPLLESYMKLVMDYSDWCAFGNRFPLFIEKNRWFIDDVNKLEVRND